MQNRSCANVIRSLVVLGVMVTGCGDCADDTESPEFVESFDDEWPVDDSIAEDRTFDPPSEPLDEVAPDTVAPVQDFEDDGATAFKSPCGVSARFIGDHDGDGLDDIAVSLDCDRDQQATKIVYGRTEFEAVLEFDELEGPARENGNGFRGLGDIDQDGLDDFVLFDRTDEFQSFQERAGILFGRETRRDQALTFADTELSWTSPVPGTLSMTQVRALDLDADEALDLVVPFSPDFAQEESNLAISRLGFYLGPRDWRGFQADTPLDIEMRLEDPEMEEYTTLIDMSDQKGRVDGDKLDDLLFATFRRNSPRSFVYLLHGTNDLRAGMQIQANDAAATFVLRDSRRVQRSQMIGDLNDDGYEDFIVVANSPASESDAFIVLGADERFSRSRRHALEAAPVQFRVDGFGPKFGRHLAGNLDFNGDGIDDLVVVGAEEDFEKDQLVVYFGGEQWSVPGVRRLLNGGYRASTLIRGNINSAVFRDVSVGDFNGDGFDDVCVNNWGRATTAKAFIVFGRDPDASTPPDSGVDAR